MSNKTFVILNSGEPIPRGRKTAEIALTLCGKIVIPFPEQSGYISGKAPDPQQSRFGVASDKTKRLKNRGDGQLVPERPIYVFEHLLASRSIIL